MSTERNTIQGVEDMAVRQKRREEKRAMEEADKLKTLACGTESALWRSTMTRKRSIYPKLFYPNASKDALHICRYASPAQHAFQNLS